jgi:hypothetical protein
MSNGDAMFDLVPPVRANRATNGYLVLTVPNGRTLEICNAFRQVSEKIAAALDELTNSDHDISVRLIGLQLCDSDSHELCGELVRYHASAIIEALIKNRGTVVIETGDRFAETFCLFEGCGVFVRAGWSYYELAAPAHTTPETVRESVLRLLKTISVALHPEKIVHVIDSECLFETLEDLGQLPHPSDNSSID